MGIPERLKEERARLGLTQPAMAELIGATKRSVINWEGGIGSPNAEAMSAIATAGADVQYILTGVRSGMSISSITLSAEEADLIHQALSKREAALLDNYRHIADEEDRKAIERTAFIAARPTNRDETQSRTQKKAG